MKVLLSVLAFFIIAPSSVWAQASCVDLFSKSSSDRSTLLLSEIHPSQNLRFESKSVLITGAPREVFSPEAFLRMESLGPRMEESFKEMIRINPAYRPGAYIERDYTPSAPAEPAVIALKKAEFEEVNNLINVILKKKLIVSPEIAARLSIEAQVRAKNYLYAQGISTAIAYRADIRDAILMVKETGHHFLNQFANSMSQSYSSLALVYRPNSLLQQNFSAMFDSNNNFIVVSGDMILKPTLKSWLLLHELRHAKNMIRMHQGQRYAFYGVSESASGRLPGLRDNYEKFFSHDEVHTYFESAKQSLIQVIHETKSGDRESAEATLAMFQRIAQQGYRASLRAETIAAMILNLPPSQRTISFGSNESGRVFALVRIKYEEGEFVSTIPLVLAKRTDSQAEKEAAMRAQVSWTLTAAAQSKLEFDVFFQVAQKVAQLGDQPALALYGLQALQHVVRPLDYTSQIASPITFLTLANEYNALIEQAP